MKNDSSRKNKLKYFIFFLIFVAALSFLIFNKSGLIKYIELVNQNSALKNEVEILKLQNKNLRNKIDSLKSLDIMIEKVAREKYYMRRKGEKVFKVEEK